MQPSYAEEAFAEASFDRANFDARGGRYDFCGQSRSAMSADIPQVAAR
jgi:hypothetical protein